MKNSLDNEEKENNKNIIKFKGDENAQNNLNKMLSQYLQKGYEITRIDLEKKEECEDSTCCIRKCETVTIFKKGYHSF